jgi:leader peptidase (prepilin peptidase)/N-methyltransferase
VLALLAQSPAAFITVSLLLGLLIGSFLNVVIWRLPKMLERQWRAQCAELAAEAASAAAAKPHGHGGPEHSQVGAALSSEAPFNLVVPRSACPHCGAPIKAYQNIPVISWLLLRGRCAKCQGAISGRYPLIEALCGALTAMVAWKFGYGMPALLAMLVTWFLIALTCIDLDHQLLPDSLTLPLLWGGLLASLFAWQVPGISLPADTRSAVIGAAAGYLSLWSVFHLFRLATGKEGMGYGDFKLLGALGAWLGWQMLLPIVLMSAAVGAIVGIALIATKRHGRAVPMPFGPFLSAAGWVAMMWGPETVARYLGLFSR